MQEFMVDTGQWNAFWSRWQDAIDQIPGLREELLAHVGTRIRSEVRQAIDVSVINDSGGRLKAWQEFFIGSKKGYAAVRSKSEKIRAGYKRTQTKFQYKGRTVDLNAGALTNFLSSGHKVRGPGGRAKRYVRRARMLRVEGADFYPKAKEEAEKIAMQEAEVVLRELEANLQA